MGFFGSFQFLVTMNKAIMNVHVRPWHRLQCSYFSWVNTYKNNRWITYDKCVFNFIRNCQNVFQNGCTIPFPPAVNENSSSWYPYRAKYALYIFKTILLGE